MKPPRGRRAAAIALAAVLLIACFAAAHRKAVKGSSDFDAYYSAAGDLIAGRSPYREAVESPYLYPPVFAVLFTPFAALPYLPAHALWFALNTVLFAASCRLLLALFPPGASPATRVFAVFFAVATLADNLVMAQANIFVLFCLAAGLYLWRRADRPIPAGVLMALGASVKAAPYLLIVFFAVRREWKVLLGWALGATLWLVAVPGANLGFERNLALLREWGSAVAFSEGPGLPAEPEKLRYYDDFAAEAGAPERGAEAVRYQRRLQGLLNSRNQALDASLHRVLLRDVAGKANHEYLPVYTARRYRIVSPVQLPESTVRVIFAVLALALVALSAALAIKDPAAGFSALILTTILFTPVARTHVFALALVPVCFLASRAPSAAFALSAGALYALSGIRAFQAHGAGTAFLLVLWVWCFMAPKGR